MSDEPVWIPKRLADYESGVRRLMADAAGEPYAPLRTLAEAQATEDGVVILEGDDGGQIYVVARAAGVQCSPVALEELLADLDDREWRDPDMAHIYYERRVIGEGVAGGMGGGVANEGVWVHPRLRGLEAAIVDVLAGRRPRIGAPE